jgi:uncharacterized protein with FMN-binding domain
MPYINQYRRRAGMSMKTAMKKARDGVFEFIYDAKIGTNLVRYQTSSGKWKEKTIEVW